MARLSECESGTSSSGGSRTSIKGRAESMARARAYNGGLGAEPPAGSRGRAPGAGKGGEAPRKLKAFQSLDVERRPQICPFLAFWEVE